ncbi:MAG: chitobiase/beta-hexosaminidase C-terminal domain-containing protein [Fibrobacteria bacterium]
MPASYRRALFSALCLLGVAADRVSAQYVDFEFPAYVPGKTIVNVDGWIPSSDPAPDYPENYQVQAGPGGKYLHALTTTSTTLHRYFSTVSGILDVRWKWRAMSDSAHFCASVSNSVASARAASRGLVCLDAKGVITTQGLAGFPSTTSKENWTKGEWHYMRMVLDNGLGVNKFTVYISEDSLRGSERLVAPAATMGGSGAFTRFVLRDEAGSGYVDFDDLSWETTAMWQVGANSGSDGLGGFVDSLWSTARNWSSGVVPDNTTHVIFSEGFQRGCLLDRNAEVRSITVASEYKGNINLGQQNLSVWIKGDFTGGNYPFAGAGHIRFPSARGAILISPAAFRMLAPVRHDGHGPVRLDLRALNVAGLTQIQGNIDFNGWDMVVNGDFTIKNGQPGTLRNLDGRTISVGHATRLEGSSKDTLLGLATAPKGWILSGSISGAPADSIQTRFASLGNARLSIGQGYAYQSVDAGGNSGWAFITAAPVILSQPKDTTVKVGEAAQFRVSASSKLPMAFQWSRDGKAIPGAVDSTYTVLTTFKADSGATFTCKLTNSAADTSTVAARLMVSFPAPTVMPAPRPFADSLSVKLTSPVAGAATWYSRNGGAYLEFRSDFTLRDSTLVTAFSVFNLDTSAPAAFNFPKIILPQLAEPGIDPENTTFVDTLRVSMTPPLSGASIYYTLDGKAADSSGILYQKSFLVSRTTTVSAVAYLAGYRRSNVRSRNYIRQVPETIPAPSAVPAGGDFTDSVVVRLSPPPTAPDASVFYFTGNQGPFKYSDSLVLRATSNLKAIAISGSKISDTATWEFRRRLEAPVAAPKTRSFADTLRIALTTKAIGAGIHYTWDGNDPTAASPLYDGHPMLLDSSATLKAVSVSSGEVSGVLSETYTLIPDTPYVSHRGGGYDSLITIALRASSARATIYYSLDGSIPGPERPQTAYTKPFNLDSSATLKAVAVTGTGTKSRSGPWRIERYTFITPGRPVLKPGARIELSKSYSLDSRFAGASTVDVEVLRMDSLKTPGGFRDILFGVRLSLPDGAPAFPKIAFNAPKGEPRSLFAYQTKDQARYISSDDTIEISSPGTYFLAMDTSAPIISFSGETFTLEDSTRLVVSIKDNVSNLLLDMERSDKASAGFRGKEINGMPLLNVALQNPKGSLLPLTVRLKVDDHTNTASFPDDGSHYALAQRFTGSIRTPAAFHIGSSTDDPWDLVAIPLSLNPALTLAQLRKNNTAPSLEAATLDPKTGLYRNLAANEPMPAGASIWLGAATSIPSLVFPALQTASRQGAAAYTLTLHHGWNQVANPCLTRMYWPVTRVFPVAYESSPLKGLHIFNPTTGAYDHAETLEPWRGYFAWYEGQGDTLVTLSPAPVAAPATIAALGKAAKSNSAGNTAASAGFRFQLRLAGAAGVSLGATPRAQNGMGLEDEPQPAGRRVDAAHLYSARAGMRLETDLVKWSPGALSGWTLVMGLPKGNPRDTSAANGLRSGAGEGARIEGVELPEGYSAWAVSRKRGLRFPIAQGATLPMHAGFTDTLEVIAGPAFAVEARLASIPVSVGAFSLDLEAAPGSFALRLHLPGASRLRLQVWSLAGRGIESGSLDLPEGVYRLVRDRHGQGYPTGLYVVSLEWAGGGKSGRLTRKIAIP